MVRATRQHSFVVRIHLERFAENAGRAGVPLSPTEAAAVLRIWGFRHCEGDVWRCERPAFEFLQDDEIELISSEAS